MELEDIVKGKKVCVTGGAGFIGSHLCEVLAKNNEVIAFDNLATGHLDNLKGVDVQFIKGDIRDRAALDDAFSGVDFVFHTAANPSVVSSLEDPESTHDVNVNGTLKVLMAARNAKVKKLVYSASSSVYGNIQAERMREDMAPQPNTPYAVSKLLGEYYCKVFNDVYGLRTTSLRYFNVFGPRQDLNSAYASVIPKFIRQVKAGKKITIEGDGEQSRDFVYVMDVAQANLLSANMSSCDGKVLNIARGEQSTINEIAIIILEFNELSTSDEIQFVDPRPADIRHSLADITLAKKWLGLTPSHSLKKSIEDLCIKGV
jgi:UDP-glucose 4-epimerase